jgi:type IV pilus assembly protein PilB
MSAEESFVRLATLLGRSQLFSNLSAELRETVAQRMVPRTLEAGEALVRQGDAADSVIYVVSGLFRVTVEEAGTGISHEVGEICPGETVGEIGLLLDERRTATVTAVEPSLVSALVRDDFIALVQHQPLIGLTCAQSLARLVAERTRSTGVRMVRLRDVPFDAELYQLFPRRLLQRHQVIPIAREGTTVVVALTRPNDPAIFAALRQASPGIRLRPVACTLDDYERYERAVIGPIWDRRPAQTAVAQLAVDYRPQEVKISTFAEEKLTVQLPGDKVVEALNGMLAAAVNQAASDIHVEPGEQILLIRFRINGHLETWQRAELALAAPLISRVKVAAGLDIADRRLPQDGRLRLKLRDRQIELRASTMPTVYGEKLVLRLLDPTQGLKPLDQVINSPGVLHLLRRAMLGVTGSVLVCGPTGAGKTTTIYSCLRELVASRPDVNICTIENPVEYVLPGVVQTNVSELSGLTFPVVLRSMLRQDPDVIMVGEMRDDVTAQIALEASLTGHLVLSTVHANSAVEAPVRLMEMGCRPYLVASAISLVVAQRLVRRICPACRRQGPMAEATRRHLDEAGVLPYEQSRVHWTAGGCSMCKSTGWAGRVGIFELLQVNERLREAIANRELGSNLRQIGEEDRLLISFKQYSAMLLLEGHTTPAEVLRQFGS